MKVLSIETSCDETGVTVLEAEGDFTGARFTVLGDALNSQAALHSPYGGVYPSLAKREHQGNLAPLAKKALEDAGLLKKTSEKTTIDRSLLDKIRDEKFRESVEGFLSAYEKPALDLIAVTEGPGLEPALWTGINFAEALGESWGIPVIGVDHMERHIISALLKKEGAEKFSISNFQFPILALLISGGHTQFTLMKESLQYEHVGATKDDAVGEAFDKVARLLELPYPGGPEIAASALRSRERGEESGIAFPRPMANDDTCDFSFSGLKTAVLYKLRAMEKISERDKEEVAQAFEDAARDIIIIKARRALEATKPKAFAVGGGVSANLEIRNGLSKLIADEFPDITLAYPDKSLTGDNAIMIGAAGYLRETAGRSEKKGLKASGSQKLA